MICADKRPAATGIARHHTGTKGFDLRPSRGVPLEIRQDLAIRLDDLENQIGTRDRLLELAGRAGGRGDQQLEVELVRIHQQADHRLPIVGIPANIRQHRQPGAFRAAGPEDGQDDQGDGAGEPHELVSSSSD